MFDLMIDATLVLIVYVIIRMALDDDDGDGQ